MTWRLADTAALRNFAAVHHRSPAAMRAALDVDAGQSRHDLLQVFDNRRGRHGLGAQEILHQGDVAVLVTVKEKTKIADFDKPRRQHVQQKAPDELIGARPNARLPSGEPVWSRR
ncbi:MAG: hypothetical protein R6V84_03405 [Desulfobacterales bacterium]